MSSGSEEDDDEGSFDILPWENTTQPTLHSQHETDVHHSAHPSQSSMISALRSSNFYIPCPVSLCDYDKEFKLPNVPLKPVQERAMNVLNHALQVLKHDPEDVHHQLLVRYNGKACYVSSGGSLHHRVAGLSQAQKQRCP
jgi:hypothetical protein